MCALRVTGESACRAGLAHVKVMAKVCTPAAVVCAAEIIAAADGVVLGRGTLGLELPAEKVFYAQKACLRAANLAGKVPPPPAVPLSCWTAVLQQPVSVSCDSRRFDGVCWSALMRRWPRRSCLQCSPLNPRQ